MINFERNADPEEVMKRLEAYARELAARDQLISQKKLERHPDSAGDPHSDAETHRRMAAVYAETADKIAEVERWYKKQMLRAMNPFFADLSDEEADRIIAEQERIEASFERGENPFLLENAA